MQHRLCAWITHPKGWCVPRFDDPRWEFHWVAGIGFAVLCFLLSVPGRLNADSLFSLAAATTPGLTNNWHSATLGWFWNVPGSIMPQPAAALVMQSMMFGIFAGFLPRLPNSARGRVALAGELFFRVALAGGAGYVGKDAVMLMTLLIAVQLLRRATHTRIGWIALPVLIAVTSLFLLVKAPNFLVIVGAAALVLPFFVRSLRRYTVVIVAALAIGTLAIPINRTVDSAIFEARDLHPNKQLVLFDLAGISVRTGENGFAKVAGWPTEALPTPASCYLPYMWDSFALWAPCGGYAKAYDGLERPLMRRWLVEIAMHPVAYIQHRLAYGDYLLESRDQSTWGIDGRAINDATNPAALAEMHRGMTQLRSRSTIHLWHPSIASNPARWLERVTFKFPKVQWVGLLICLSVLLASWMRRQIGVRLGALLSAGLGTGNVLMLGVFGVADPGRYMLPTVGLAYMALLAMVAPAAKDRAGSAV